jgi:P pilus assembly chaperone PapD
MKKTLLFISVFSVLSAANAAPSINVGAMQEYIDSDKRTLAKRINNSGSSTAFVRVTVDEIVFKDGGSNENPLDSAALIAGKGTGLVASPARLIIPAKGMQVNRLVFTGNRDRERYYRVRYLPVVPESGAEFGLSGDEAKTYREGISAGLTVLSGYGTIVTVRPDKVSYNTQVSTRNNEVLITNGGNSSVVIEDLRECASADTACTAPKTRQLIPGASLNLPLTTGKSWKYTLIEGSSKKASTAGQ